MNKRILLIEDNLEMADNISAILKLAGYTVLFAPNGIMGVKMAQQFLPDLILCDIMMPEMDGYSVLHILVKEEETANIPFIFLTAKTDPSDFRTGMNLGADDYITKPFDGVDLLRVIEMRLRKKELSKPKMSTTAKLPATPVQQVDPLEEFDSFLLSLGLKKYKKRDLIFMEGHHPNNLYYLKKGEIKTYKTNSFGKDLITGIHKEGSFLGYIPLLEDKPYNENAEALTETELSAIPKIDFLSMVYSQKAVAQKFLKLLSCNLEEMENRLLDIAYQSVRQRVAGALLRLIKEYSQQGGAILITIARRDISSIIGTTTESLNRTLADFKDERLIEITSDGLKILDKQRLQRIVNL